MKAENRFLTPPDYEKLIEPIRVDGSLYTSDDVFQQELERIWYKTWVFVGHTSEIPKSGDYVARHIGLQPVLMVRDRGGNVNVFHNRCTHRGNLIVNTPDGNLRAITCPYHGWAFNLSGELVDAPHGKEYTKDFLASNGLNKVKRMSEYRGFIFASLSPEGPTLLEHMGEARRFIDRLVELSPVGEVELTAGWVRHKYRSNWKMLFENDTDGYHVEYVHKSFVQAMIGSQVPEYVGDGKGKTMPIIRDWGGGHTELDFGPGYRYNDATFEWLGRADTSKLTDYVTVMEEAYGKEKAREKLIDGPPHAIIFPNLFIAELSVVIFQPVSANQSVQWHCPVFFKGVPESLNRRMIRQAEGALGPGGFLVADDQIIAERNQDGLISDNPKWLDLSRGYGNEKSVEGLTGVMENSDMTAETTNRSFWKAYKSLMSA